jgi:YidC/Oxa1 family membrane protein insertase
MSFFSKSQQPASQGQKPNNSNLILIFGVLWLAGLLYFQTRQDTGPKPTVDQLYAMLLKDNAQRLDASIVPVRQQYDAAVDDLVKAKKLTAAEGEEKKIGSAILVADTQFKAGIDSNQPGRMRDAYNTIQSLQRKYAGKPVWENVQIKVADVSRDPKYGWSSWSGSDLYQSIVARLTKENQKELVYGLLPGYSIIDFLVRITGAIPSFSYAFAAFFLALIVRAVVFPLSQRQLMFSRQMSQLTPLVKEIKGQYPTNPSGEQNAEIQKRTMALYQEYGINPLAGCGPALIQMPLFLTVYQLMLRYQFAFQKGTFLWINPALSKASGGFIAANLGQTDYILIVIYGITMLSSTLLTPATDPSQAKQQRLMSVGVSLMFTFFMLTGQFPVVGGFVLYWVFTNLFSTAQSLRAYRLPLPPLVKVNAAGGGVYPTGGSGKFMKLMEQASKMAEDQKKMQDNGSSNGSAKWLNGSSSNGSGVGPDDFKPTTSTGKPVKHKPKKRK